MDTPKRVGPTLITGTPATVYTVPSNTTFLMRSMRISNNSSSNRTVLVSIGTDSVATRILGSTPIPANTALDWSGFMPMAAGEIIQTSTDALDSLTITVGGVEVT